MKVLFISKRSAYLEKGFGGAETSMKLMAETLAQKDHTVFYISRNRNLGLLPRLIYKKISGVNVAIYSGITRGRRFQYVRFLDQFIYERLVRRILKKGDIEVAYCNYELPTMEVLFKMRTVKPGLKIVMRMAGMNWYEKILKDRTKEKRFEKAFNLIDGINYVHQDQEPMVFDKLNELGMEVSFKYSFVADIGFSVGLKRQQPYRALNNKGFKIINATRFSDYQKRQDLLVETAARISPEVKVNFRLIGDGKEKEKIKAMIGRLDITDRVTLMPFMSQEELWREIISADLMCHACDYEGLSKIILEAMALGLPVLVSDVAPVNGYIEDGVNGFLVANDPDLWAKKIEDLIKDYESRVKVSNRAMRYVEKNYNPQKNITCYEYHFKNILEG